MAILLVAVGSTLALIGYAVEQRQPKGFNRGKAVGLSLFLVGEVLLFEAAWWWGVIGLLVPPILINIMMAITRRV